MNTKTNGLENALTKTAGMFSQIGQTIKKDLGSKKVPEIMDAAKLTGGLASTGILAGYLASKAVKNLMNQHDRKALVEDLCMNDAIIRQADPERVKEFYATIHHIAPSISNDKNVVRELLQNFIKFDRVDLNSVKALADTHKSMTQGRKGLAEKLDFIST
jgi:hypothetical protein